MYSIILCGVQLKGTYYRRREGNHGEYKPCESRWCMCHPGGGQRHYGAHHLWECVARVTRVDTLIAGHWFDVLALLLSMAAPSLGVLPGPAPGRTSAIDSGGGFLTGFLFILAHEFIRLGIAYELAPGIAEASAATRASLEVMADTLRQTSWLAAGVGFVLIFGIGVLLFSFAILRTSVVPKWIGWLGLINVAANTALVTILSGVFDSSIRPPWLFASGTSLGWVLAMGVVLLRLQEPVAAESET